MIALIALLAAHSTLAATANDSAALQPVPDAVDVCLRAEARVNPQFPESVQLRLVLDEDGVARDVGMLDAALRARPVVKCLRDAFVWAGPIFPAGQPRIVEVSLPRPNVIADADVPPPSPRLVLEEPTRPSAPEASPSVADIVNARVSEIVGRDITAPVDPEHERAATSAAVIGGVVGMGAGAAVVAVAFPELLQSSRDWMIPLVLGGVLGASFGSAVTLIPFVGIRAALLAGAAVPLGMLPGAWVGATVVMGIAIIGWTGFFYYGYVESGSIAVFSVISSTGPSSTTDPFRAAIEASIWGCGYGAITGLAIGAPLGALVGAVAGPAWVASEVAE